jgi:hypothetical protein
MWIQADVTYRLTEGLSSPEIVGAFDVVGPLDVHECFHGLTIHSSKRAAGCRAVPFCPVARVLMFARAPSCVGFVLPAQRQIIPHSQDLQVHCRDLVDFVAVLARNEARRGLVKLSVWVLSWLAQVGVEAVEEVQGEGAA